MYERDGGVTMNVWKQDDGAWSNAREDRVVVEPYDPSWPSAFEQEAVALRKAILAGIEAAIEHFGSTAVLGLAAKPIVDIMLVVPDRSKWPHLIAPLESLGYVHWADNPNRGRMFFVKGMPPYGKKRTHHVHVRAPEDAEDALIFRDHLRSHPETATRYGELKRALAAAHETDRETYTAAKSKFMRDVLSRV